MSNLLMNKDQILRSNDKKAELIRFIAVGGFATFCTGIILLISS